MQMDLDWHDQIAAALDDFVQVAQLSGETITAPVWNLDFRPAPHRSSGLPAGMMAIYAFWGDGVWLKIGKVGANSDARFRSQHYLPGSARSTLAGSILADTDLSIRCAIDTSACGDWIRANTHRCNVLLPASYPKSLLSLLEAFLHHRLKPRYEG